MKPLHASITRLNRCPCCHSKYTANGAYKLNNGKSAARHKAKQDIKKELKGE